MLRVAVVCMAGMLAIPVLARVGSPSTLASASLAVEALVCTLLAAIPRLPVIRPALILVAAAFSIPIGYFFGPNSVYGGVLVIVLVLVGMLTARDELPKWFGWLVAGVISGGELVLVVLAISGVLDGRSVLPTPIAGRPLWQPVVAHLALQAVYGAAFFIGRAVHGRYQAIVDETLATSRRGLIRTALLEEARADRPQPIVRAPSVDPPTEDVATHRISEGAPSRPSQRAPTEVVDAQVDRWFESFRANLVKQDHVTLVLVLIGLVLLVSLVRDPIPRIVCLVSLVVIAAMVVARKRVLQQRPDGLAAWPALVSTAASVGPAYAIGLHSGIIAPMVLFLFVGRLFRAPNQATSGRHNLWFVVTACVAHAAVFVAVMTGLLADAGLIAIVQPGGTWYEPYALHALVQTALITGYVVGKRIDDRFALRYQAARVAFLADLRSGEELRRAREDVAAARDVDGLFTDTEIGPYRVGRLLGHGGMGEVYRAEHADGTVALKLVRLEHMRDALVLERFEQEVAMLMRIQSPYCARVLDAKARLDLPYLAMEFVDGPSLSTILRERELDAGEIATLVSDVTRGLDDIHAAGVLHLDLKPGNLILGQTAHGKRWKIVDFGIAQLIEDRAASSLLGTPRYMAPERARGLAAPGADLYSAALIFLRVVTGEPFVPGGQPGEPLDPRSIQTPQPDLNHALRIALAPDPADRFATATELRDAVEGALTNRFDDRMRRRGLELLARLSGS